MAMQAAAARRRAGAAAADALSEKHREIAKLREQIKERDAIKTKIVEAKPHAGQLHHYTTRINTLSQAKAQRQKVLDGYSEQRVQLDAKIAEAEAQISELWADTQELEALRWKVSAKAPTADPGDCSLRTLVPAMGLSVEKLGQMLQGLGADDELSKSVSACFDQLRALVDKADAAEKEGSSAEEAEPARGAAPASSGTRPGMPTPGQQQAAQDRAAPMDTDDITELRDFLRTATGQDPPQEEEQVREAIKRMANAAEALHAKKQCTGPVYHVAVWLSFYTVTFTKHHFRQGPQLPLQRSDLFYQPSFLEVFDRAIEKVTKEVLERRAGLRGLGGNGLGAPEWDTLELAYGLPYHLMKSAPQPLQCLVFHWGGEGGTRLPWDRQIYTDGSGLANASPELRRRGWAAVEMLDPGLPLRAVHGPLPGRQSAPRAERHAGLMAMKVAPQDQVLALQAAPSLCDLGLWRVFNVADRPRAFLEAASDQVVDRSGPMGQNTWQARQVRAIQESVVQQLRSLEVRAAGSLLEHEAHASEKDLERLQRRLLQTERRRRRRNLEVGSLRKALREVRSDVIDESTPPSAKHDIEAEQLLSEVRAEREEWYSDKRRLEEQIHQLEEENQAQRAAPASDPEKEKLKRQIKQLQMSIDSRDRYACWVCNQQATAREASDTDGDASERDVEEDDEVEAMRKQLSCMKSELKKLKGLPSCASTPRGSVASTPRGSVAGSEGEIPAVAPPASAPAPAGPGGLKQPGSAPRSDRRPLLGEEAPALHGTRLATPFVAAGAEAAPRGRQGRVTWLEAPAVVEVPAASDGPLRASRARVATPHVAPDGAEAAGPGGAAGAGPRPHFAALPASTEEMAVEGPLRSSRSRTATPFAPPGEAEDAAARSAVRFAEDVDAAAVPLAGGGGRSVATPGVPGGGAHPAAPSVQFSDEVSTSPVLVGGGAELRRSSRSRVNTPFAAPPELAGLEEESPSRAAGQAGSVRDGAPAPSVQPEQVGPAAPAVSFQTRDEATDILVAVAGEMRDARRRTQTPAVAGGLATSTVRFSPAESVAEAASPAPAHARALRTRTPTGFVRGDASAGSADAGGGVRFAAEDSVVEAASAAPAQARSLRTRTPTGFVHCEEGGVAGGRGPSAGSSEGAPEDRAVRFAAAVSVEEAASSAPASARSVRDRVSTGFAFAEETGEHGSSVSFAEEGADAKGVHFAGETSVGEAASSPPSRPRSVRDRISTGFAFAEEFGEHGSSVSFAEEGVDARGVRFAGETSVGEAASSAPSRPRSVRDRVSTGFAFAEEPGVHFANETSVGEAASLAPSRPRPVRDRVSTGFAFAEETGEHGSSVSFAEEGADARGVRFAGETSVGEAASSAPSRPRSVRDRASTGFAFSEEPEEGVDARGVRFAGETYVGEAASSAPLGAKPVRDRVSTGFAFAEEPEEGVGVRFAGVTSVGEAASSAPSRPRSVRDRVSTGFAFAEEPEEGTDARGVRFAGETSVGEAASSAPSRPRSVRDRASTGFAFAEEPEEGTGASGVRFADETSVSEAASLAPLGAKPVRDRVSTGFAFAEEPEEGVGVRFAGETSVGVAASSAPSRPRSVRDRASTGFAFAEEPEEGFGASDVRFADETSVGEAASSAPLGAKPVRDRVSTGFAFAEEPEEGVGVRFAGVTSVGEAASSAPSRPRSVRDRASTGFAFAEEPEEGTDARGVRFAGETSVGEAASSAPSRPRSVRDRASTEFAFAEEPEEGTDARGVRFAGETSVGEAASSAPLGAKPVRDRASTGFAFAEEPEEGVGVRFAGVTSVGEAASSAPSQPRSLRDRASTGFAFAEEPEEGTDARGVRFAGETSVGEAASSAPLGAKPVRDRASTGFAFAEEPEEGVGVRFAGETYVGEAASSAPLGAKPVRDRASTGFAFAEEPEEGVGVRFTGETSVGEAASSAPSRPRSVRDRASTGFAFAEEPEEGADARGVRFAGETSVGEAASPAPLGAKPVRDRASTGFAFAEEPEEGVGVRFAGETSVGEAASSAPSRPRSVRDRASTGFAFAEEPEEGADARGVRFEAFAEGTCTPLPMPGQAALGSRVVMYRGVVRFSGEASVADAASASAAEPKPGAETAGRAASPTPPDAKPVRTRQATGLVRPEEAPPASCGGVELGDAEGEGEETAIDNRFVTFRKRVSEFPVSARDVSSPEAPGVQFSEEVETGEAPSAEDGRPPAGGGTAGGHEGEALREPPPRAGLRFASEVSQECVPGRGEMRPVRSRTPTGFVDEDPQGLLGEPHADGPASGGVAFTEGPAVSPMAVPTEMKSTRSRTPTGWHGADDVPHDDGCVRFSGLQDSEASSPSSPRRTATRRFTAPQFKDASGHEGGNIGRSVPRVDPEDGHEDAASDAETVSSRCSSRNPRSRMNTPYLGKSSLMTSAEASPEPDEARLGGSSRKPIRARSVDSGLGIAVKNTTGVTPSDSDRDAIKSVGDSNMEREIASRVQRNAQRQAREDRECSALPAFPGGAGATPLPWRAPSFEGAEEPGVDFLSRHRVDDVVKDTEMLRTSLRGLTFFEEFDDDGMEELIKEMEVYQFEDQEKAVRQGDTDGTHFFVVAEGEFVVERDREPKVVLVPGRCFGESVLMLFGERNATVVSRGRTRAYGMEGMAVREMLRTQYEQKRASVVEALDEVISSNGCEMLSALNAYQLQSLYDRVEMRRFEQGATLMEEGPCDAQEVIIICSGSVKVTERGQDLGELPRFAVAGDRAMVFQESPTTLTAAKGPVQVLVLTRSLLETIFGDQLEQVLVRHRLLSVLAQHPVFSRIHEEQRQALATACVIRQIQPGQELTGVQICEGVLETELPTQTAPSCLTSEDYWLTREDMRLALQMQLRPDECRSLVLELRSTQDLLSLLTLFRSTAPEGERARANERFCKVVKRMMEHRIPQHAICSIPELMTDIDDGTRGAFREWLDVSVPDAAQQLCGEVTTCATTDVPMGAQEVPILSADGFRVRDQVEISAGEVSETRDIVGFGSAGAGSSPSFRVDAPLLNAYPPGATVARSQMMDGSPRQPSKQRALENYERFHNLPRGTASFEQVAITSAGIAGWSSTSIGEVERYLDHCYFYNLEIRGLEPKCRHREQCRKVHARMPDAVFETMAAPKRARDLRFAIVLHGEVETRPAGDEAPAAKVTRHSGGSAEGCTFGEEMLLHRGRRWNLLVKATSDSPAKLAIWRGQELDPVLMFDNLDFALEQEDRVRVLKTIFLFQTLAKPQLTRLAGALQTTTVAEGQRVFSQGDAGAAHFYVIRTGLVAVDIDGRRVRTLGKGDYFGERALLGNEPRSASVVAVEEGELWMMNKGTFQEIMQGPCLEYLTSRIALQDTRLEFGDLDFVRVVGRGGFGVVKMVKARRTDTRYALKCMRKRDVVERGQQEMVMSERSILAEVDHPFMVKYVRSFKTKTRIYFLMELVSGGELLDALDKMGLLNHQQAMFYTGSIVLALEFLHERRIAYLDLKAENCLIDRQGYLKLIDFGIAQRITAARCHVSKGTPVFMAPEMILGKGYTTVADLWSLGVCLYDFVVGEFPFANGLSNWGEIANQVVSAELRFPPREDEPRWEAIVSLIRGLLNRDPVRRLGAGFEGFTTLKEHAFFRGLDWDRLLGRELIPPFLPECETYAEDKEAPSQASSTTLRPLEDVEAEIDPRDEGWQDPDPGWDADF
ncbi:unnamed protein product [Prorocentrum cordatum]|uniref:cGMP-dependent protein kinase n=1 Tax=Prorocentrum cordatum TaxID=2364126 RepID=A0ABN9T1B1_9DINO|nr:unnamed protein product [Polarella glacialis]